MVHGLETLKRLNELKQQNPEQSTLSQLTADRLLLCPFCGGAASQGYSNCLKGVVTGCQNEGCDFKPYCISAQRKSGEAAWNKRAGQ